MDNTTLQPKENPSWACAKGSRGERGGFCVRTGIQHEISPDYFGFVDKIIRAPEHTPQMDILIDVEVVLPMQPPGVHLEWFAEQLHFPAS